MQRKFRVFVFYENQEALDRYLYSFYYDKPIKIYKSSRTIYYEYEHFKIECFKQPHNQAFKSYRCDLIAIEKILTKNDMWIEIKNNVLRCMLASQRFKINIQEFE